jgi:hypothetical protein
MDIRALIEQMLADGVPGVVANNPRAQFGTPNRRYLGSELLPERQVEENVYMETAIRYRTVVANAGTRYSPVQIKGPNILVGEFLVKLGEQDIGAEFTSRDYDGLLRLLGRDASMEAIANLTRWLDISITRALLDLNEVYRWQCLIDALVQLRGNNGYAEDVAYSNPAGHRANAAGAYTGGGAVDPILDIYTMRDLLASKGYRVNRIVAGTPVISKILSNPFIAERLGSVRIIDVNNNVAGIPRRPTLGQLNSYLAEEELPPIERYDEQYNTETGTQFFLKRDVLFMAATTGQEEQVRLDEDNVEILENVLGYHAIGRAAGQAAPGRVIRMEAFDNKPPRIEGEGWQTSLPVLMNPEAVAVIQNIT